MLELWKALEGHEFVVGLWGPGVDLDGVPQGNDQKFDPLVFDDFEVNCPLEVAHIDPTIPPLLSVVRPENLRLEPRQVVDPHSVLFAWDGHQDVLALKHFHLLEPTPEFQKRQGH